MKSNLPNDLSNTLQDPEARCRLLQSVVLHANDSIVITEANPIAAPGPRIVFVNEAFCRMTGYRPEEVLGKTPRILQGPKTDRATLDRLKQSLLRWEPTLVELLNYRKDGTEFWIEMSLVPVADAGGWYTHWIAIQRETSDRKQLEAELLKTLQKERELSELKSQFVTMTSHEFRTPLTAILTAAELLEYYSHNWTETDRLEHLRLIQSTVHRMTQMLEDILLLGQVESGGLQLKPGWFDLSSFCQALISEFQIGKGRHHHWKLVNALEHPQVYLDQSLLRQALASVLSNAVKYSAPDSEIVLKLSDRPGWVQLCLQDEGIGLNLSEGQRLFELFSRGKNVGFIPGSGLGLAIAKRCLDLCSGHINLHSEPGRGTQVTIEIPVQRALPFD